MRAAFLDLNGTLVLPVQVRRPDEYSPIPCAAEAVCLLTAAGFLCPIVTVQSRIGKGLYSERAFLSWFARFRAELAVLGAPVIGPYLCHHSSRDACACKKPKPGLYLRAAADLGLDVAGSVAIGDTAADVRAAREIGCRACLVRTGWGEHAIRDDGADRLADYVAADILDAVRWAAASASQGERR